MLAEVFVATGLVVTLKLAVVAPAATVTLAGTCATVVLSLASATTAPPAGALPFSVTVAVELVPPSTLVGLSVTDASVGGFTVNPADTVPPYVPEMFANVEVVTGLVVTVKVAVVDPAATVTLAETCAADVLSLASVTTAPPAGASPFSVTVPVELFPPRTPAGLSVTEAIVGGVTVNAADWVVP